MVRIARERVSSFIKKYFFEGQRLASDESQTALDETFLEVFVRKHRKVIGFAIPFCFFNFVWWSLAIRYDLFKLFPERYQMSITMIFGALIAGMTSEGGGAIAFPVMTLVLHIEPAISRDFSLMIQSCGMTAASFVIIWMGIVIEWHSVVFCSLGAVGGVIFGLEVIDPRLTAAQKKMGFVSIWFSFAMALFLLNIRRNRRTFDKIPDFKLWKMIVLIVTGFLGGNFTAFSGSGVDICSFSILTLLFHVSEKVAVPTSVVLMAINTLVGFYWRQFIMAEVSEEAWEYLAVCVPIVVFVAPFATCAASYFHRLVLASFIYVLETVALIGGFVIVKPDWALTAISASIVVAGFFFFLVLSRLEVGVEHGSMDLDAVRVMEKEVETVQVT